MKVIDLIDKLSKYPPNSTILIWDEQNEVELDISKFISLPETGFLEIFVKKSIDNPV